MGSHNIALPDDLDRKEMQNMCTTDLITILCNNLTWLGVAEVWQERHALVNVFLLHKLVSRDLVPNLHKMKFADDKGCGVGVKVKHIRPPSNRISRFLVFQWTYEESVEYYMFCYQKW